MRKKGFTIIELIVAVAILITGITAYGVLSTSAMRSYKQNKLKITNLNYSDTIANVFKANGKLMTKSIYENNERDVRGNVSYYIYFNNVDELESALQTDRPDLLVTASVPGQEIGTYESVKAANAENKENGAFISVSKIDSIGKQTIDDHNSNNNYNINMYGVFIKTWCFNEDAGTQVSLKIYLGR